MSALFEDQERMNKGAEIANLANDVMDTIGYMSDIFTCGNSTFLAFFVFTSSFRFSFGRSPNSVS